MRIAILVEGGVVQQIVTDEYCEVHLMDYDDLEHVPHEDWTAKEDSTFPILVGKAGVDSAIEGWKSDVRTERKRHAEYHKG